MTEYKCFECRKKIQSEELSKRFVCPQCGSKIFFKPRTKDKKMTEQDRKIREIQMLEQNFQNLLMQKQAFQMELSENKAALEEIEHSGDEVYKIIGQLMIKSDKTKIKKELESKEKILGLRMKNIEEQEKAYTEKLQKLQKEALKEMKR